jgi:hypothetical protein
VNGEDRRRKVAFLLLALAAVMAVASAAFAVSISVAGVDQLGGTGQVGVECPANPCQISRVKWVLTSSDHQYLVDQVKVVWKPASSSSEYTVCVTLFDDDDNAISGGCKTDVSGSGFIETPVDVSDDVDPAEVYKVQIVIVQE